MACMLMMEGGAKLNFPPQTVEEAQEEMKAVLSQPAQKHGHQQTRWQLETIGQTISWLNDVTLSGVSRIMKRLGFSKRKACSFTRSPDPLFHEKWGAIVDAYAEAISTPDQVTLLFQDELTYYRKADVRDEWQTRGTKRCKVEHRFGANTKARVTGTLNPLTGQLQVMQRYKIGVDALIQFYAHVREAYANVKTLYLVQDNWPVHKHPRVLNALQKHNIQPLFLPTYASWLNPIEKVWRWLRQDILHNHRHSDSFKTLRKRVLSWLTQFENGSEELLRYVGLLSKTKLKRYQC